MVHEAAEHRGEHFLDFYFFIKGRETCDIIWMGKTLLENCHPNYYSVEHKKLKSEFHLKEEIKKIAERRNGYDIKFSALLIALFLFAF